MLTFATPRTITLSGAAVPELPDGEAALLLRSIEGEECLSEIYSYTLECVTPLDSMLSQEQAANLDLKGMIGAELMVAIQLDGMGTYLPGGAGKSDRANVGRAVREISGIVTSASFIQQNDRQSHYRLIMQPWLQLATLRSDYRIFQNKSVIEIIEDVLHAYGYSWHMRLSSHYPALPYQVQYGETDFDFIQRLMQEHGIYWFFEHSNTFHRMVLLDQLGAHQPVDSEAYQTLSYYPPGHKIDREYIDHFDITQSIRPGHWYTDDYDFQKPKSQLSAENTLPQDTAHNTFEQYEWPGDYTERPQGEQFARVRMEELHSPGERASGSGNLRAVVCGTTFTLAGYPLKRANQEYLVLSAQLAAKEIGESRATLKKVNATEPSIVRCA